MIPLYIPLFGFSRISAGEMPVSGWLSFVVSFKMMLVVFVLLCFSAFTIIVLFCKNPLINVHIHTYVHVNNFARRRQHYHFDHHL